MSQERGQFVNAAISLELVDDPPGFSAWVEFWLVPYLFKKTQPM